MKRIVYAIGLIVLTSNCTSIVLLKSMKIQEINKWKAYSKKGRILEQHRILRWQIDSFKPNNCSAVDTLSNGDLKFAFRELDDHTFELYNPKTLTFGLFVPIIPNPFFLFGSYLKNVKKKYPEKLEENFKLDFYMYDVNKRKEINYDSILCFVNDSIPMFHIKDGERMKIKGATFSPSQILQEITPNEIKSFTIMYRDDINQRNIYLRFRYERKLALLWWKTH